MEFNLKGKAYRIEKSKDDKVHARIEKGVMVYILPGEKYDKCIEQLRIMIEENKRKEKAFNYETDEALRLLNDRENKAQRNLQIDRREKTQREIKRTMPTKKKKYSGSKRIRVKAFMATLLIAASIGLGGYGVNSYIQNENEYNKVAASVENLTDDEIREEIKSILEKEISNATHESVENIDISQYSVDSGTIRTEVEAGKNTYREDLDLRSPVSWGNSLKSTGIRDIISKANNAEDRKGLIKALRDAIGFSKNKNLEVDGDTLKEVKAKDDDEGR